MFPFTYLSIFISVVFIWFAHMFVSTNIPHHNVITGVIAVLYIYFFNASGTFFSQMTLGILRHLSHPAQIIFVTNLSHHPSACMVEPK